jgi:Rps23 Pro-64 3,4-dihydroxylase Tpa1-like proline 4-hydroxylase
MNKNLPAIEFFLETANNISHGNGDYVDHCFTVYTILKNKQFSNDLCLAGLYHSIYGTDSFKSNFNISRDTVINFIGTYAESLVYTFSTIANKDNAIADNYNPNDDLFELAVANLESQLPNNLDPELINLLNRYKRKQGMPVLETSKIYHVDNNLYILNNKEIFVFDNFLQKNYIESLHDICLSTPYTLDHGTSKFIYERDFRVVCHLNRIQFDKFGLNHIVQHICNGIHKDLYVANYYINYYTPLAPTYAHTDSACDNTMTILIFPNKFWESHWGGAIRFTNEEEKAHYLFDYVPGRIIVFDSRLEHEVLPVTTNAKSSRFSIAIKCAEESGKAYLEENFGTEKIIKFTHE